MDSNTRSFEPLEVGWQRRFSGWVRREFGGKALGFSLVAALLLYLLETILVISLGALIFKGELRQYLPIALVLILFGNAALVLVTSIFSSYPGTIAASQDTPAVIIVVAAATLVAALPAAVPPEALVSTILVLILGTTITAGLAFLGVGFFKLGGLVRFLPYPVMGGFLAGTGWLLVNGGISVMTDLPLGMELFSQQYLLYWTPGIAAGVMMVYMVRRFKNPLSVLWIFGIFFLLFYATAWLLNIPFETLQAGGWLLGPFPEITAWRLPISRIDFSAVIWPALLQAAPEALSAILIGMIALLLNASSLELVIKRDLDINRELITAGLSNVFAGFLGGLVGYHTISYSSLNHNMTGGKRLPGYLVAVLSIVTVFLGTSLLAMMPRMLLGGLLAYVGLSLLYEWVIGIWKKFPIVDSLIVITILITIAISNFLWGIVIGTILTVLLFVVSYSRVNVVRYTMKGTSFQSRLHREVEHAHLLQEFGDQIFIFKLEGFIFFGTANFLYEQVHDTIKNAGDPPIHYMILDFELVSGLDSTGMLSFEKMLQYTQVNNVRLIFSGLKERAMQQFRVAGFEDNVSGLNVFEYLDQAVEWCESNIIAEYTFGRQDARDLATRLRLIIPDEQAIEKLLGWMTLRTYSAGEYLIRAGDPSDEIMLIERGRVTAQLEHEDGKVIRLETTAGGRVMGELGFYLEEPRSAYVIADTDTRVFVLSRQGLEDLQKNDPESLHTLSRIVIHQVSQRVLNMTRFNNSIH